MDPRTQVLLEAPIARTLLRLAVPNILVLGAQAAAGLIETYFIGKLGTESLAGVALVFPVVMLMQMMSAGAMGGGISSAIARALGGSRGADANALVLHAVMIAVVFGLTFMLAVLGGGRWLYGAMGAEGPSLDAALTYSNWVFAGAVLIWLFNSLAAAIRATGNMAVPAIVTLVGTAILIPLSPVLIFGWGPFPAFGHRRRRYCIAGFLRRRDRRLMGVSVVRQERPAAVDTRGEIPVAAFPRHPARRRGCCPGQPFDESHHHDRHGTGRRVRNGSDRGIRDRRATGIPARTPRLRVGRSVGCHGRNQHRSGQPRARLARSVDRGRHRDRAHRGDRPGRRGLSLCLAFSFRYRPRHARERSALPARGRPLLRNVRPRAFLVFRFAGRRPAGVAAGGQSGAPGDRRCRRLSSRCTGPGTSPMCSWRRALRSLPSD